MIITHLQFEIENGVRHECLCITGRFGFKKEFIKALKKIIAVVVVLKYVPTFYSPYTDMMQDS